MTPQLQQAIRLLQLSTLELQTEIQQALESNPMLEEQSDDEAGPDEAEQGEVEQGEVALSEANTSKDGEEASQETGDAAIDLERDQIPDQLPVDSQWDDVYDPPPGPPPSTDDAARALENRGNSDESLQQQLRWQLDLTPLSPADHAIGQVIIDAIDDEGFLHGDLEEFRETLGATPEVELDEIAMVLKLIQSFDPIGVGARDLRESLLLQLAALTPDTPALATAQQLVSDYFDLLGRRDFRQLKRRAHLDDDHLAAALDLIRTLKPRPGNQIDSRETEYIAPDVYVFPKEGEWRVELSPRAALRIGINSQYAAMIRRGDSSADNTYLKNNLQEARWLIKSLQSRNDTLLRVAVAIVERQRGFLEHGEEKMVALILADIANELGMHESTISRVTTSKYMHTPRGVFELKYFFSSHVGTASGGEASSTAIRAVIKRLVAGEQPRKPLSDNKIAGILDDQGYRVARRTVAKYRESMAIPSSSERKRLA